MAEKLYIDGFAGLNNFEIELNKINVLIGEQASGKSVVAKMLFFFQNVFIQYVEDLIDHNRKTNFLDFALKRFNTQFVINNNENFTIQYETKEITIKFFIKENELKVTINDEFSGLLYRIKQLIKFESESSKVLTNTNDKLRIKVVKVINEFSKEFYYPFYIPAERAFFTAKYKEAFNINRNSTDFSLFHFSNIWNNILNDMKDGLIFKNYFDKSATSITDFISKTKSILKGDLIYNFELDDFEFKYSEFNYRLPLESLATGTQVALPMLYSLFFTRFDSSKEGSIVNKIFNIIEEPENHLFPKSAIEIIKIISIMFNISNNKFLITTHSPFVLSTLNNLIKGGRVEKKFQYDKKKLEELYSIIPKYEILNSDDLNVYQIVEGSANDIKDNETGLISENIIDEASEDDYAEFDKLLDLAFVPNE